MARVVPQPKGPSAARSSYVYDPSQSSFNVASIIKALQSSPVANFIKVTIELPKV